MTATEFKEFKAEFAVRMNDPEFAEKTVVSHVLKIVKHQKLLTFANYYAEGTPEFYKLRNTFKMVEIKDLLKEHKLRIDVSASGFVVDTIAR